MILTAFGTLSAAQVVTNTEDSDNVIQYTPDGSGVAYSAMTDIWWVVSTYTAADVEGTLKFELVMAQESGLSNVLQVCCVDIAVIGDKRVATAGRFIAAINVGKTLKQMIEDTGSDYEFIGMIITLAGSTTITIDAELSPTEPHTIHHKMATESNVTTPVLASVISGFKT